MSDEKKNYCINQKKLCDGACDGNVKVLFEREDCVVYQMNNREGELVITEHSVFPGIWLCYKDAHIQKFSYPASYPTGLLEITHCREGRFEYDTGEQFYYLSRGDMSINKSIGKNASVYCPTQHYHGISVLIDPKYAPHCLSCFLEDVYVNPDMLIKKFCMDNKYFIMRSTAQLEHIFSELYSVKGDIQKGYFKVKILELMMFLSSLDPMLTQTEQHSCSRAQVMLAKDVCEYVNTHMEVRLTIEQLAGRFFVSPAWLKKCFYSVYGESVQAYIREYKMQFAANVLKNTDQSITEIANSIGYKNNSKFSMAFRSTYGVSPTEYRRGNLHN